MGFLKLELIPFILFGCLAIQHVGAEPHCSKFHYEEQLLEKMVRLEFKLEQMEEGYKDMERKVGEALSELQKDRSSIIEIVEKTIEESATQLNDMKAEMKRTSERMLKDVQDATSALETSRIQNEAKLTRMSEDMRRFNSETVGKQTRLTKVPEVFFKAEGLASTSVPTNKLFVFNTLLENQGEGYDADTGMFTAASQGNYLFIVQMCNRPGNTIYMVFVVDDVEQSPMTISSGDFTCGTGTLLARLNSGARVALKSRATTRVYSDSDRFLTFSGILLN